MAVAVKHKHLSQYLSFQSRFTENACFQDYNLKMSFNQPEVTETHWGRK